MQVNAGLKADARGTVQLAHHHALGAIDDEGALKGHERNFAHVDLFFLGGPLVFVTEGHIQRRAEGLAFTLALDGRHFGLAQVVADEIEAGFLLKTENGEKFLEDRLQTQRFYAWRVHILLEEFVIGIDLELNEVWGLDGFLKFAEVNAFRHGGVGILN